MFLTILFLCSSLVGAGSIYYFAHLYEQWYYFFVPILLVPVLYVGIFCIYVVILYLCSLCMNKKKEISKPNSFWYFWVKQTVIQLLLLSRTRIKVTGKEKLDKKKRYLVITNHISNFDPIVAIVKLGLEPLVCVSKKENLRIPVCGSFIHHAGFIFLDREDNHSAIQMVRKSTEYIKNDLASIYICPEGTRSKTKELLPFHPGSFKIATRAETDVLVCFVENTDLIAKHFPFRGTKVQFKILQILPYEEIKEKTTSEIADIAYHLIKNEKR